MAYAFYIYEITAIVWIKFPYVLYVRYADLCVRIVDIVYTKAFTPGDLQQVFKKWSACGQTLPHPM